MEGGEGDYGQFLMVLTGLNQIQYISVRYDIRIDVLLPCASKCTIGLRLPMTSMSTEVPPIL